MKSNNKRYLVEAPDANEIRDRLAGMLDRARANNPAPAAQAPAAPPVAPPAAPAAPAAPRINRPNNANLERGRTNRIRHTRIPGRARPQMEPHQDHDLDVDTIINRQSVNEDALTGPLHYKYFNSRNIGEFTPEAYMFSGSTPFITRCIREGDKYFSYANKRYYVVGVYAVSRDQGAGHRVGNINKVRLNRDDGVQIIASETLVMKVVRARRPIPPQFQAAFLRGLARLNQPRLGGNQGVDEFMDLLELSREDVAGTQRILRQLDAVGQEFLSVNFDQPSNDVSNDEVTEMHDDSFDMSHIKDGMLETVNEMRALGCDDDVVKEHITDMYKEYVSETELNELFNSVTETDNKIRDEIEEMERLAGLKND